MQKQIVAYRLATQQNGDKRFYPDIPLSGWRRSPRW